MDRIWLIVFSVPDGSALPCAELRRGIASVPFNPYIEAEANMGTREGRFAAAG